MSTAVPSTRLYLSKAQEDIPSLGTAPVVTADEQRLSVCLVVVCLEVQNTRELEEAV